MSIPIIILLIFIVVSYSAGSLYAMWIIGKMLGEGIGKTRQHLNIESFAPHRWDGKEWTCLVCGHISPDPCDCKCHGELIKKEETNG